MLDKGKKSFRPVSAWSVGIYFDYVSPFSCFSCLFRFVIIIFLVATLHRVCSALWVCFLDGQTVSNRFAAVFKLFTRFCRGLSTENPWTVECLYISWSVRKITILLITQSLNLWIPAQDKW